MEFQGVHLRTPALGEEIPRDTGGDSSRLPRTWLYQRVPVGLSDIHDVKSTTMTATAPDGAHSNRDGTAATQQVEDTPQRLLTETAALLRAAACR